MSIDFDQIFKKIEFLEKEYLEMHAHIWDQDVEINALRQRIFDLEFKNHCDKVKQKSIDSQECVDFKP